jgi:hypothetical protein
VCQAGAVGGRQREQARLEHCRAFWIRDDAAWRSQFRVIHSLQNSCAFAQDLEFFINVALWDVFHGPIWN